MPVAELQKAEENPQIVIEKLATEQITSEEADRILLPRVENARAGLVDQFISHLLSHWVKFSAKHVSPASR